VVEGASFRGLLNAAPHMAEILLGHSWPVSSSTQGSFGSHFQDHGGIRVRCGVVWCDEKDVVRWRKTHSH
jgi:hypothetical protein